jgi:hypothetical protein
MWICSLSRRQFSEFTRSSGGQFRDGKELRDLSEVPPLNGEQIALLWPRQPDQGIRMPTVILVGDDYRREFFAWALTYLPELRPLTSFTRVVTKTEAQRYERAVDSQPVYAWQDACLGLILGEASSYAATTGTARQMSLSGCASTYSFVMTSAWLRGISGPDVGNIGNQWARARLLTKQSALVPSAEQLALPWGVLRTLGAPGDTGDWVKSRPEADVAQILRACDDLGRTGEVRGATIWETDGEQAESSLGRAVTREERVARFETAARRAVSEKQRSSPLVGFQLAYMASQISPGTFEHFSLLLPYLASQPSILVWYGLIAGLTARAQNLKLGGGLGLRVLRDALQTEDWLSRPTCDVGFLELEILLSAENPLTDFRVGSQSQLCVELSPGVKTFLRWPPRVETPGDLFPDQGQTRELRDLVHEMNMRFNDLDSVRTRLSRILNVPEGFRDKRGRRPDTKDKN